MIKFDLEKLNFTFVKTKTTIVKYYATSNNTTNSTTNGIAERY